MSPFWAPALLFRYAMGRPSRGGPSSGAIRSESGLTSPGGTWPRLRDSLALGWISATRLAPCTCPRRRSRGGGNGRPPSGPAPPASRKACDSVGPPPFSGPLIEACAGPGRTGVRGRSGVLAGRLFKKPLVRPFSLDQCLQSDVLPSKKFRTFPVVPACFPVTVRT
jgi:hypothetical protein